MSRTCMWISHVTRVSESWYTCETNSFSFLDVKWKNSNIFKCVTSLISFACVVRETPPSLCVNPEARTTSLWRESHLQANMCDKHARYAASTRDTPSIYSRVWSSWQIHMLSSWCILCGVRDSFICGVYDSFICVHFDTAADVMACLYESCGLRHAFICGVRDSLICGVRDSFICVQSMTAARRRGMPLSVVWTSWHIPMWSSRLMHMWLIHARAIRDSCRLRGVP